MLCGVLSCSSGGPWSFKRETHGHKTQGQPSCQSLRGAGGKVLGVGRKGGRDTEDLLHLPPVPHYIHRRHTLAPVSPLGVLALFAPKTQLLPWLGWGWGCRTAGCGQGQTPGVALALKAGLVSRDAAIYRASELKMSWKGLEVLGIDGGDF